MLDVQSQVSNFMFSYIDGGAQFRARGALPSQAREGTPLPLNWTATIIPSACHMFNLSLISPVTLEPVISCYRLNQITPVISC